MRWLLVVGVACFTFAALAVHPLVRVTPGDAFLWALGAGVLTWSMFDAHLRFFLEAA